MGSAPSPRRGRSRHVFALAFAIAAFFGLSDRAAHGQVARTLTPGELRAISGNLRPAERAAFNAQMESRRAYESFYDNLSNADPAAVRAAIASKNPAEAFSAARVMIEKPASFKPADFKAANGAIETFAPTFTNVPGAADVVARSNAALKNASFPGAKGTFKVNGDFQVTETRDAQGVVTNYEYMGNEISKVTVHAPGLGTTVFDRNPPPVYPPPAPTVDLLGRKKFEIPAPPPLEHWKVSSPGAPDSTTWVGRFDPNGADGVIGKYTGLGQSSIENARERRSTNAEGAGVVSDKLFDNVRAEDKNGRILSVAAGHTSGNDIRLSFDYDPQGNLTRVKDENGKTVLARVKPGVYKQPSGATVTGDATVGNGGLIFTQKTPEGTSVKHFDYIRFNDPKAVADTPDASFVRSPEESQFLADQKNKLVAGGLASMSTSPEIIWEETNAAMKSRIRQLREVVSKNQTGLSNLSKRPDWNAELSGAAGMLDTAYRSLAEQEDHLRKGNLGAAARIARGDAGLIQEAHRGVERYRKSGPSASEVLVEMGVGGLDHAEDVGEWAKTNPVYAAGAAVLFVGLALGPGEIAMLVGTPLMAMQAVNVAGQVNDMREGYKNGDPGRVLDSAHALGGEGLDLGAGVLAFGALRGLRGAIFPKPGVRSFRLTRPNTAAPAACEKGQPIPQPGEAVPPASEVPSIRGLNPKSYGSDAEVLTTLANEGIAPTEVVNVGQGKVTLSELVDIGHGRLASFAVVEAPGQAPTVRVFYRSNSQGLYRVLPARNQGGFAPGYDKGPGEWSLSPPPEVQAKLADMSVRGPKAGVSSERMANITESAVKVNRSAMDWANARTEPTYIGNQMEKPINLFSEKGAGIARPRGHSVAQPESLALPENLAPNYGKPIGEYTTSTSTVGEVKATIYPSKDGSLAYTVFQSTNNGQTHAWFGEVAVRNQPINSFGVGKQPVNPGELTTPLWEYTQQIGHGYAGAKHPGMPEYSNAWNYIRQMPELGRWYQATKTPMPAADAVPAWAGQKAVLPAGPVTPAAGPGAGPGAAAGPIIAPIIEPLTTPTSALKPGTPIRVVRTSGAVEGGWKIDSVSREGVKVSGAAGSKVVAPEDVFATNPELMRGMNVRTTRTSGLVEDNWVVNSIGPKGEIMLSQPSTGLMRGIAPNQVKGFVRQNADLLAMPRP